MPFENAVLTKITAPGTVDRYGDPTTAGGALWTGRAAGYLKRIRRTVLSSGQQVAVKLDVFTILDSAGAPALQVAGPDWEASTVIIEDHRTATPAIKTFRVVQMEHRQAGLDVDSVRIELEEVA